MWYLVGNIVYLVSIYSSGLFTSSLGRDVCQLNVLQITCIGMWTEWLQLFSQDQPYDPTCKDHLAIIIWQQL